MPKEGRPQAKPAPSETTLNLKKERKGKRAIKGKGAGEHSSPLRWASKQKENSPTGDTCPTVGDLKKENNK